MIRKLTIALAMSLIMASGHAFTVELPLFDDQQRSLVVIVIPQDPDKGEQVAARELVEHLDLLGSAPPEQVQLDVADAERVAAEIRDARRVPIVLGRAAVDALRPGLEGVGDDGFRLRVDAGIVRVAGLSSSGTLNGVYELLEQLGFRWFMPGDIGRTLPLDDDPRALSVQDMVQMPSFSGRRLKGADEAWTRRNRFGGVTPPAQLAMAIPTSFEEQPELYALVDGQRMAGGRGDRQLCLSNPGTIEAMAERARATRDRWVPMGNRGPKCECDDCRALDPPGRYGPFTGGINVTDRYVRFGNRVLESIEDEDPDQRLSLQVIAGHVLPPVAVRGHDRLDVTAWTVARCRIHGAGNPICPDRMMVARHTAEWIQRIGGRYHERTAWGNVSGPGVLFPQVHRFRSELPYYHSIGVAGFTIAAYPNWVSENPSSYIGARLLWDHEADVDALLADFYRRYYGPAAGPMQAYHELIETTMRDADHHTGSAIDMPHIYPLSVRTQARERLEQARARTEPGPYRQRVAMVLLALDYCDAFLDMIERRDRHDHAGAVEALDRAHAIGQRLRTDFEIPLLAEASPRYLDRIFGDIVRQGHRCTGERGDLVAGLDDRWAFLTDPDGIGEALGLHRGETTGGNWQSIRGWSSSWSSQGLHYYRGDAWYRQSVDVPAAFEGRQMMLWVGGVDDRARVWVNGHLLGDSPARTFSPFEFDATAAIKPGDANVIVIRTRSRTLEEVGTGGLLAPVLIYAPKTPEPRPP